MPKIQLQNIDGKYYSILKTKHQISDCNNADDGVFLFQTDGSTNNTPYKQGITSATQGMIVSSVRGGWGVQLALQNGDGSLYLRVKGGGTWYEWGRK